ncbi:hypothetical protein EKH79_03495 [Dyella dinghuensis]|uniref:Uncharacterized protein n=1 Tax=Dyella dinghuensis TaxID=1920169 RepID=A0A432LW48_9GAMM|nr:hypothetical protein [Dyella dinghuensis]RUL65789.1 hypothetical protein EKH79_03495 [Dyella dinghuensis]
MLNLLRRSIRMESQQNHAVDVSDVSHGAAAYRSVTYCTGGLISFPLDGGKFGLAPVWNDGKVEHTVLPSNHALAEATKNLGVQTVGTNQIIDDGIASTEIWRPRDSLMTNGLSGADTWAAISTGAHLDKNDTYADAARYVSVSMQAAGVRLRDVAKCHHAQLIEALLRKKEVTVGFKNVPLLDLYVAFHSLASELCSARDHLVRIAALHVGAKESLDDMIRLEAWLKKEANQHHAAEPLTKLLTSAWGTKELPQWLRKLSDVRNQMVHRQPLAANPAAAMLRLREATAPLVGTIKTIRLAPAPHDEKYLSLTPDPFETLLGYSERVQQLVIEASKLAHYRPTLMAFKSTA